MKSNVHAEDGREYKTGLGLRHLDAPYVVAIIMCWRASWKDHDSLS